MNILSWRLEVAFKAAKTEEGSKMPTRRLACLFTEEVIGAATR